MYLLGLPLSLSSYPRTEMKIGFFSSANYNWLTVGLIEISVEKDSEAVSRLSEINALVD